MDVLIEFCRTGRLGPIAVGVNAAQVEEFLGRPNSTRDVHGMRNRQQYRYGDILMLLTGLPDKHRLSVDSIKVDFHDRPMNLPEPIAKEITLDWPSISLDEILAKLHASGTAVVLRVDKQVDRVGRVRRYAVGENQMLLSAVDEKISYLEREEG